jgi:hypothetical protein
MLIKRPAMATQSPAASSLPNRQSSSSAATRPNTFAQGWEPAGETLDHASIRDPNVEPASTSAPGNPREERSLLVKPR